ncbi:ABA4-like family protein [Portibacter marinus]|uniref:ABA4-like family protein n=1 Tax=Portibacter marinus TaxID=2898660 RepID=UPI001F1E61DF|nr:ABA4-like family protein [Portibacter marinus]
MTANTVFSIVNPVAMIMWLLMILTPNWKVTRFLMDRKIIPVLLSCVYAIYIIISMRSGGLDFSTLESVMELFTKENAVLAGWVHYLAFDLLVGMWILDQNRKLEIHHLIIVPCLIGTFMLGPIGFLLFIIIRRLFNKQS